nr:MAG TPA: hypothetical protein [Caudoviricetes sp.]
MVFYRFCSFIIYNYTCYFHYRRQFQFTFKAFNLLLSLAKLLTTYNGE